MARALRHRLQKPDAKIEGQRFHHARRPPAPADILNQNRLLVGIPNDSIRWDDALAQMAHGR